MREEELEILKSRMEFEVEVYLALHLDEYKNVNEALEDFTSEVFEDYLENYLDGTGINLIYTIYLNDKININIEEV